MVDNEYTDEQRAGRQIVLDKIAENGFEKCMKEVRWCPLGYSQTLRLILSEGRAEIEEDLLEDMMGEINGW